MNTERLLRLADKLQGKGPYKDVGPIKVSKFNIDTWVETPYTKVAPQLADDVCGTAACACGWAAVDPWFKKRGLHLRPHTNGMGGISYHLVCGDRLDFDAAAEFFGIKIGEAHNLFSGNYYPTWEGKVTPTKVAKRIRAFVAQHQTVKA